MKTLILFEKAYESTEEIAKRLALILGPANYCDISEFKEEYKDFDILIFGIAVYRKGISKKALEFIQANKQWIKDKKIALFYTTREERRQYSYTIRVKEQVGEALFMSKAFRNGTENIKAYARALKEKYELLIKKPENESLFSSIEAFIKEHNTLVLGTGYGKSIRVTPLEYVYIDKTFYSVTEGGEKFSNLIVNNEVALTVYDKFTSYDKRRGIQITGKAFLIPINSEEYKAILMEKNIEEKENISFCGSMHILKIKPEKAEFLNYEFEQEGYDIKQVYYFNG
ncbi:flavodoxin domain-containing protein [Clostridium cellulovorans]|uniref:Pyridoxamine 5'-phosphate oxidase-related FMN-binding n=1 Tax=Clostridium cellulovorans (strain ATCC 35296 / DSM 3052 / OCM 3 / 743B) TaxID=573061 RepID=D9SVH5_CLOC7|nr:flavodoxin domain-containing protein [Clostridium cellulovorans]ADL51099.1 pyridoxamine 5'-phosphate oxidase-related FMN-binding [Clostridium cellulovorans 743B]